MERILPREKGAYAALFFPLISVFALGEATREALLITAAILALFLALEPMRTLFASRRPPTPRLRGRALRRTGFAAGIAALLVLAAMPQLTAETIAAGMLVALLAAVAFSWIAVGAERELVTQTLVFLALVGASLPVAFAAQLPAALAFGIVALWMIVSAVGLAVVHDLLPGRGGAKLYRLAWWQSLLKSLAGREALVVLVLAAALPALGTASVGGSLALVPMPLAVLVLLAVRPQPRRIRAVGWTLVSAHVLTLAALLAAAPRPV